MLFWNKNKKNKKDKIEDTEIKNNDFSLDKKLKDDIFMDFEDEILGDEVEEELSEEEVSNSSEEVSLETVEYVIADKSFFLKQPSSSSKKKYRWHIGPMGKLVRTNILRWWWAEIVNKLDNIYGLKDINNDKYLFKKYKAYAKMENLSIPFGISRVMKSERDHFDSTDFALSKSEARKIFLEFFIIPEKSKDWLKSWKGYMSEKLDMAKISRKNVEWVLEKKEVKFGSQVKEIEEYKLFYDFPFGKEPILAISNREDIDFEALDDFEQATKLKVRNKRTNETFFPHIIRVSLDQEKFILALILDKLVECSFGGNKNISILLDPIFSPIKCAVLPKSYLNEEVADMAQDLYESLKDKYRVVYQDKGTIDVRIKHYREFGVPFFVIVDVENLKSKKYNFYDVQSDEWMELTLKEVNSYIREKITVQS